MMYLGALVHADGEFGCEISRRLGAASAEFKAIQAVWKASTLPMARKINLFKALVCSKLKYDIVSAWLFKASLKRMDGFQAKWSEMQPDNAHYR